MSHHSKEYDKNNETHGLHFAHATEPSPSGGAALLGAEPPKDEKPASSHRALKITGIVVGVIALIYIAGVITFNIICMPRTKLYGQDVSFKSAKSLAQAQAQKLSSYKLAVSGDNVTLEIASDQIGLGINASELERSIIDATSPWQWPVRAITGNNIDVESFTYDHDRLKALVDATTESANASATPPTNASVAFNESSSAFEVTPSAPGTQLDAAATLKAVTEAVESGKGTLELGSSELVQPTILSSDPTLIAAAKQANTYASATQTLVSSGATITEVAAGSIAQWITIGQDFSVALNGDAIKTWTQGDLSKQLDTVGTTRSYTRPDGKAITVSGGTYGWSVDGAALAETISANIAAGTPATVEIPWKQTAATRGGGGADWGARYIDIDLSEQYSRMYDDAGNLVWESSIVTGNPNQGNATPEGVYSVTGSMGTNQVLLGLDENHDGEPDYKTPVSYWIPFVGNLVALHDANWRSSFGGTIYQSSGSHGCVNLPPDKAAELYGLTNVGDVVVVHS